MSVSSLLSCALKYNEMGFKLHPLTNINSTGQSPGKRPRDDLPRPPMIDYPVEKVGL